VARSRDARRAYRAGTRWSRRCRTRRRARTQSTPGTRSGCPLVDQVVVRGWVVASNARRPAVDTGVEVPQILPPTSLVEYASTAPVVANANRGHRPSSHAVLLPVRPVPAPERPSPSPSPSPSPPVAVSGASEAVGSPPHARMRSCAWACAVYGGSAFPSLRNLPVEGRMAAGHSPWPCHRAIPTWSSSNGVVGEVVGRPVKSRAASAY